MNGGSGLLILLCLAGMIAVSIWATIQGHRIERDEAERMEREARLRNELARYVDDDGRPR